MTKLSETAVAPNAAVRLDEIELSNAMRLSHAPGPVKYLAALALTAVVIVAAVVFDGRVSVPNLSLVFVIPVVISAVTVGLGPSLCSAVLSAVAYNYFLVEPRYSLAVEDPANIWAIGLLFAVGCIASAVASIAWRKADDVLLLKKQAAIVRRFSHEVTASDDRGTIVSKTVDALEALFHVPSVVLMTSKSETDLIALRGSIDSLSKTEIEAAKSSIENRLPVPADVYPFNESRFDFWSATTRSGQAFAFGLAFDPDNRPVSPGAWVEIVGNLTKLAVEIEEKIGNHLASRGPSASPADG